MKPQGDIRSLVWKARTKAARRLVSGMPDAYENDDFDWSRYHLEYEAQIDQLDREVDLRLRPDDLSQDEGRTLIKPSVRLHPNHRLLYETIAALGPSSVLEAGCGGGDHLHNVALLLPQAQLRGIDRSSGQLALLKRRNSDLSSVTQVVDLTLPHPKTVLPASLVYTQAVIMHIQTGNGHLVALWNVFSLAQDYVLLVENWNRHDFPGDIRLLHERGILPWEELHMSWVRGHGAKALLATRKQVSFEGLDVLPVQ